jgi:DNA-binding NarL/FixJ family response regulator
LLSGEKIRILIVDDHPEVCEGLRALLQREADLEVAGIAINGAEALALFRELAPHIAVIDWQLPDMDGVTLAARLIAEDPDARLLMISSFAHPEDVRSAHHAGVKGYLPKDALRGKLAPMIRVAVS